MTSPPAPGSGARTPAADLFADFVARVERGAASEFDALCLAHPERATELRELKSARDRAQSSGKQGRVDAARYPISAELRARYGNDVDPSVSLGGGAPGPDSGPSTELMQRLRAHAPVNSRYRMLGEVGRGGMGAVLKIWDEDLRRTLAMKVVLGKEDTATSGNTPAVDARTLGRFLEEAQVTGQLDHPGIVPVHELGLAPDGRVYFTMRLVKGEDLRVIFEHVASGHDGWNETRALGVLLKVCEAMSYAHDKGVVHRDLKPANVMVGKYGEVYVMDWGLARVLGHVDRHDVRLRTDPPSSVSVRTARREERADAPDSPLVTMDGDVMGTPTYMAPEQARGDVEQLGPHSDVYAVGAMLYHLLTGEMPFVPKGVRVSPHAVLMRLLDGPPKSVLELVPRVPAELVAICEKAMERDIGRRYADMPALARDLRAFLENRVVNAYETGLWAETRKWVLRNRTAAGLLLALIGALAIGLAGITSLLQRARAGEVLAQARATELAAETVRVNERQETLDRLTRNFMSSLVADTRIRVRSRGDWKARDPDLQKLQRVGSAPWGRVTIHHTGESALAMRLDPVDFAAHIQKIQESQMASEDRHYGDIGYHFLVDAAGTIWQGRALEFQGAHAGGDDNVGNIGIAALGNFDADDPTPQQVLALTLLVKALQRTYDIGEAGILLHNELRSTKCPGARLGPLLASLLRSQSDARTSTPGEGLQFDATGLARLSAPPALRVVAQPERGVVPAQVASDPEARLAAFVGGSAGEDAWATALRSIADPRECPAYHGLQLRPQWGLVPLGRNPATSLWEFYAPSTGKRPNAPQVSSRVEPDTAVVFVLVPGGRARLGAQAVDASAPHYDPDAESVEAPVHEIDLDPFLLAKYELTSLQLLVMVDSLPNVALQLDVRELDTSGRLPAFGLSRDDCLRILEPFGMRLPTEAQWEWAARSGTHEPWYTGSNAADVVALAHVRPEITSEGDRASLRPVDDTHANAFGLHGTMGNVWEWCADSFGAYEKPARAHDGLRWTSGSTEGVLRGGSLDVGAAHARMGRRGRTAPDGPIPDAGVRPARKLL